MTRAAQLAVLAAAILLLALFALWPDPAASEQPVAASRIPAAQFVPLTTSRSAPDHRLGEQADARQGRTGAPLGPLSEMASPVDAAERPSPSPSASVTPVRATSRPLGLGSAASTTGTIRGIASWMPERYGADYLALPEGAGVTVEICAATCLTMTSNDAGPDLAMQRAGRVVDIAVLAWERICGVPRPIGLCQVHMVVVQ